MRTLALPLVLMLLLSTAPWAQGEEIDSVLDTVLVSADFHNAPLVNVLNDMLREQGVQFVFPTEELQGMTTTAQLRDVPLGEALEALLGIHGLTYDVVGENILVIVPFDLMEDYRELAQDEAVEAQELALLEQDLDGDIALTVHALEMAQANLERARAMHEAGNVPQEQVAQAEHEMLRARHELERLERRRERVAHDRVRVIEGGDWEENLAMRLDELEGLIEQITEEHEEIIEEAMAAQEQAMEQLQEMMERQRETASAPGLSDTEVRTMRVDDECIFRQIRVIVVEVEENDPDDDRDEDVTMIIDTMTSSEERTIEELRSEIIDDYRIRIVNAEADADPMGYAVIEITWLGGGSGFLPRTPQFSRNQ
jgi:Secretin and TonB N terminus short domain